MLLALIACDVTARLRDPSHKLVLGHDLLPSYTAGLLIRQGTPRLMYDRAALSSAEIKIIRQADLDIDGRYGPWLNPPFYAWTFVPLAALPYRDAAAVFLAFNILLTVVSLTLLSRMLLTALPQAPPPAESFAPANEGTGGTRPETRATRDADPAPIAQPRLDWRTLALVPLLTLLPLPFWQAMGHQQNTFISLLLLVGAVIFWRRGSAFAAGATAGLLFYKPQLGAILALVMIFDLRWRALAGLTFTGTLLLAITLFTLPGCLGDFLHRLPPTLHWLQIESPYNWGRQVTYQSFWRLMIQGHMRGETHWLARSLWWFCSGAMAIALGCAVRTSRKYPASLDRLIAASIASMPLLMPYFMDYDLLLLSVPVVLLAADWIRAPQNATRADYVLLFAWAAFALETHLNPGLASHSRLNLAVPLLTCISLLHIARCVPGRAAVVSHIGAKTPLHDASASDDAQLLVA